jgi:predicted nucleic acid-binding protein
MENNTSLLIFSFEKYICFILIAEIWRVHKCSLSDNISLRKEMASFEYFLQINDMLILFALLFITIRIPHNKIWNDALIIDKC